MSNRVRLHAPINPSRVVLREMATAVEERPAVETKAVHIAEATPQALAPAEGSRRYRARLIRGNVQGSSGWYGDTVLREAAPNRVFPAGLGMYADHPTPTEEQERPARSIRDLAAKLVTDARYEGDGLYAVIEVYPHWVPVIEAMKDDIGLSIRASGVAEYGKPEGQRGPLITELTEAYSVDFVTRAGAGGAIVSLLESAREAGVKVQEARNIGGWLEAQLHRDLTCMADDMYGNGQLSRDERITLSSAIGDALDAWTKRVQAEAPQLFQRDLWDGPDDDSGDTSMSEAVAEATRWPISESIPDDVKSKFVSDLKTRDTPVRIAAGMRRLSQWAASGHYPTGTTYEDLKWFYNQCADELKRRDPKSSAGGNFPAAKSGA